MGHVGPELAYDWRPGEEPALVFLHGLGCDNNGFAAALEAEPLRPFALLRPDLVGHGATPTPPGFGFGLADQARSVRELALRLGIERLAIVSHSLGGAVGILLAESWPGEVLAFANAVGNLVSADCFFSRRFLDMGERTFTDQGFPRFQREVTRRDARTGRPPSSFPNALLRTSARAVFESSRDLVRLSDEDDLLGRFCALPCAKLYLQDEDNPLAPGLGEALAAASIPITIISNSGHGLMEDNPGAFYAAVGALVSLAVGRARATPDAVSR